MNNCPFCNGSQVSDTNDGYKCEGCGCQWN